MAKTIICSVGTSAAKGLGISPAQLVRWVEEFENIDIAAKCILETFENLSPTAEFLKSKLSAEIHSLVRIGITQEDRVILLSSNTSDGQACSKALEGYLSRHFNGIVVQNQSIDGLQVQDSNLFERVGVVNYVRTCLSAINDFGAANVILNPTGGFKALVPYTVLIGMLKRVPCRYVFEQSEQLLTLPPLPVTIDRGPFEKHLRILTKLEENIIALSEWEEVVQHADQKILEPMIERHGTEVTLSGIGLLFLDEIRKPSSLVPYLSREAWKDCLDNLRNIKECDPFRFLRRVAEDPNHFKQAEHINAGYGLRWLKPGRTTDRYLVSIEGWRLLVWRAIREDELGPQYESKVKVVPEKDRGRFGPFIRMEFSDES